MSPQADHLSPRGRFLLDRRNFLSRNATAIGSIALTSLLGRDGLLANGNAPRIDASQPFAPRHPHYPAKAKNVLVIFCAGAVSQLETWDYKPDLIKHGRKASRGRPCRSPFRVRPGNLARPQYEFHQRRTRPGKWVSDMIPHLAELTDDIAFIHSLTSETNTHGPGGELSLHRVRTATGSPAWEHGLTYALGSENQDLPAFRVDPRSTRCPPGERQQLGSRFSPRRVPGDTLQQRRNPFVTSAPGSSVQFPFPSERSRAFSAPANECERHLENGIPRTATSLPASPATNSPPACN